MNSAYIATRALTRFARGTTKDRPSPVLRISTSAGRRPGLMGNAGPHSRPPKLSKPGRPNKAIRFFRKRCPCRSYDFNSDWGICPNRLGLAFLFFFLLLSAAEHLCLPIGCLYWIQLEVHLPALLFAPALSTCNTSHRPDLSQLRLRGFWSWPLGQWAPVSDAHGVPNLRPLQRFGLPQRSRLCRATGPGLSRRPRQSTLGVLGDGALEGRRCG